MKKQYLLLMLALGCFLNRGVSQTIQPCGADEMHAKYKQNNANIALFEKIGEDYVQKYLQAHKGRSIPGARTTSTSSEDTGFYEIPVVVHVMHNYGSELLSDNKIYNLIKEMNAFYSHKNNTSSVVSAFQPYIGNARIRFHLATIDPNGNATNGITHRHTYLTYGYDDQCKQDQWSQSNYYNIWFENVIGLGVAGGTVLAYATFPSASASNPLYDGVICGYQYIDDGGTDGGSTLDHETGHYLGLAHTWNSSGKACGEACGDDGVDDTPPTKGHYSTCPLSDSACASNYFKTEIDAMGSFHVINYPDTTNVQNVMDYSNCTNMFTKGQVDRIHGVLNSTVAFRSNLWDSTNLANTGCGTYVMNTGIRYDTTRPGGILTIDTVSLTYRTFVPYAHRDLKPTPEFMIVPNGAAGAITKANYMDRHNFFTFPDVVVKFLNASWNDTVTGTTWTFPSTAATPSVVFTGTTTATGSVTNKFTEPGWVTMSMKVTGNNSGDTTSTWNRALYVADNTATPGLGYYQEFDKADTAKWPMFNYYGNNLHWQHSTKGYYDNNSIQFVGFDDRSSFYTGNPRGDFDDLYSVPFDLSSSLYPGACSMNFYYTGASRTSNGYNINDTLIIQYTTDKINWKNLTILSKGTLCTQGSVSTAYEPTSQADWQWFSMNLPADARTNYTTFRFRYRPGTALMEDRDPTSGSTIFVPGYLSTGNNFFMDRITFSPYPAGVNETMLANKNMAVMPNPTTGNAFVILKDELNTTATVSVVDITGKEVYHTASAVTGAETTIEIPKTALSVSGMYLVRVVTGNQVRTQKLVVE